MALYRKGNSIVKKIIISEKGNIGFVSGSGARNINIVFNDADGEDLPEKELEVNKINDKDWNGLIKDKEPLKKIEELLK